MSYTIILVDDEDDVRGRIASKIEGQEDFVVIGSASNGYDALDLLEEEVPDVVITDVKMPFVDGIELTRIIKERYPTVKVAIISGYDDYSLLKDAINLDVIAYLAKPISTNNIRDFLGKIKKTLDEENEHIKLKEGMVLTQIRDRIINLYLSNNRVINDEDIMCEELGVSLDNFYVLVSSQLLNYGENIIEIEKKKNQCFMIIDEIISEVFNSHHIVYGNHIVSIIEVKGDDFNKELDILLYKAVNYLEKYLSVEVVIGVSSINRFNQLSNLYRQSQLVLEEFEITNQNTINYYSNLNVIGEKKSLRVEDINEFKKNIRYAGSSEFENYTKEFSSKITNDHGYDCFSVIVTISGLIFEYANSIESNVSLPLDINAIKTYVEDKNIDGFMILVRKLANNMKAEVLSRETKKSAQMMSSIIGYIETNFSDPEINMDKVCEKFHISISYLSALFKKETDTTFNRYLVGKRIEHAKFLLSHSEEKIIMIAEKCGYKDVYYFSHSFKKVTGQSPKGFRKNEVI